MATPPDDSTKRDALAQRGVLHPCVERVSDDLFSSDPFFDPRDLVQVKYEMLRHVRVDGHTASAAAEAAGLSRPTFYSARAAFEANGIVGLLPARKGPRRAHKLSDEVLDLVETWQREDLDLTAIAERLREERDLTVHPRSIERALARRQKRWGRS